MADKATVALIFTTEERDDNNYWSVGQPTRITIPETGWYSIGCSFQLASGVTAAILYITLNGAANISVVSNSGTDSLALSTNYYFSSSDYIEFYAYQDSGGSLNATNKWAWCNKI
jgi:hypothetical protein